MGIPIVSVLSMGGGMGRADGCPWVLFAQAGVREFWGFWFNPVN